VAVLLTLTLTSTAGAAATSRVPIATINGLSDPHAVGVDQTTGDVYVIESGQIARYTSAGAASNFAVPGGSNTITQSGLGGAGEAQIAVDNAPGSPFNGAFYVRNGGEAVAVYASTGEKLGELTGFGEVCGVAVDQSSGALYVGDYALGRVRRFVPTSATTPVSKTNYAAETSVRTAGLAPCPVAVDKAGHVYASGYGSGPVRVFSAAHFAASPPFKNGSTVDETSYTVTTDPATDDLYVSEGNRVAVFNSSGSLLYHFGSGAIGSSSHGVAVKEGGNAYVTNESTGSIVVFGPPEAVADATGTATTATPSYFSATLNGTVTDNGPLPTNWRIELSKDGGSTWSPVPSASGATAGGQSDVAISGSVTELSLNTTYKFRVVTNKDTAAASDVASSPASFTTLDTPDATGVATSVTAVTATSATFNGTVTDNGPLPTNWRVELSRDGGVNWTTASTGATAGGESGVAVSSNVTGLAPNTPEYRYRLVTDKGPGSPDIASNVLIFATPSVPPLVSEVGAVEVEDTSARFAGTIDPSNAETSYVFEYGTTPALGSSTAPLAIGGGTTPIVVSQVVSGLAKDTTYYVRLTATNPFGSTPSTQATFHTRTAPAPLPDNRGYELVSPDKAFGDAVPGTAPAVQLPVTESIAYDGEAMVFGSVNGFGEPPGQILRFMSQYRSQRQVDGWHTQPVFPNTCANDLNYPALSLNWIERPAAISADADHAVIPQRETAGCDTPPLDPAAPVPATNLYRANFGSSPSSYDLLAPNFGPQEFGPQHALSDETGTYGGGSDDFSHVFYSSGGKQTPDSPDDGVRRLYEWDNGTLRIASVDQSGNPFTTGSSVALPPENFGGPKTDAYNAVSSSGDRVFFDNPTNSFGAPLAEADIYLREGGSTTYKVSESECTNECGSDSEAQFRWADVEGDEVVFSSAEKLTDTAQPPTFFDQGVKLYAFRLSPNPSIEQNLTLISEDNEPADGTKAEFKEVLGMADDGSTVFFTDDSQLVAGEPTTPGEKIYRWSWNEGSPTLQYLATASQDLQSNIETSHWERRVSQEGNALMIETSARVDPVADHDGDIDVYLWREGKGWNCVSCQHPETPSGGPSTTTRVGQTKTSLVGVELPVARKLASAISTDGSRVFFVTPDSLVPLDVNGPCPFDNDVGYYPCSDVYEWHDGRVSLITPGDKSADNGLIGISESGNDVFFYSRQSLVGWDGDTLIDVYDARVGGGFPEPPPQPAACEGEACRGAGTAASGGAGAGTAAFQGPGDPKPKRANKHRKHRKHHKKAKKHKTKKSNRAKSDNRRTAR
jgi:hypothetical protein